MSKEGSQIPLSSIGNEYPIKVVSAPPHRQDLAWDKHVLDGALKTLDLQKTPILLYFYRDEPRVIIAPNGQGKVQAIEGDANVTVDKRKKPPETTYSASDKTVHIRLPYEDKDTKTVKKTAKTISGKLSAAMGKIPLQRYRENFKWVEAIGEFDPLASKIFNAAFVSLIGSAVMTNLFKSVEVIKDISYVQWSLMLSAYSYAWDIIDNIKLLRLYRNHDLDIDHKDYETAGLIDEDPRRILYPSTFVHTVVVPGFFYRIGRSIGPDLITSRKP